MGAPVGNHNAARGSRWRNAIERALERRSKKEGIDELDRLAEKFLDAIEEAATGTEKRPPSIAGFEELGDRLDGKTPLPLSDPDGGPLSILVKGLPGGGS